MGIKSKLISILALTLVMPTYAFAQITETAPTKKVTLESLLAQTLEATKTTQATFDQQTADGETSNDAFAPNIAFAPAIEISYKEVVENLDQNIGVNVRWGGQVIESVRINDATVRLTVFAYPLSNEGRPLQLQQSNQGGQFVVDLVDGFAEGIDFSGRFLTFYGGVASGLIVSNGNRQKKIPVIKAQEFVDWNMVDQNRTFAGDQQRNSYYYLGVKTGQFSYSSRFYSPYYSSRFGLGFSSVHNAFGGRGFSRRGFSRSRGFSRGFGFSRRGFSRSRGFSRGFGFRGRGFSRSRGFRSRGFRRH